MKYDHYLRRRLFSLIARLKRAIAKQDRRRVALFRLRIDRLRARLGGYTREGIAAAALTGLASVNASAQLVPQFAAPVKNPFGLVVDPRQPDEDYLLPHFVDIDGDGDLDMFSVSYETAALTFQENIGTSSTPAFGTRQSNPFGLTSVTTDGYSFPAFGDIDGDGDVDLIISAYTYDSSDPYTDVSKTFYIENVGSAAQPSFTSPTEIRFAEDQEDAVYLRQFFDLDADGDLDILSLEYGDDFTALVYFENTAGPDVVPEYARPVYDPFGLDDNPYLEYEHPVLADFDGDGDVDILSAGYTYEDNYSYDERANFTYRENIGNAQRPVFGQPIDNPFGIIIPDNEISYLVIPTLADIDGDGDQDLFVFDYLDDDGNDGEYRLRYFENIGVVLDDEEAIPENTLTVYPNPADEVLYFKTDSSIEEVKVHDVTGRTVLTSRNATSLDVSGVPPGLYTVELRDTEGDVTVSRVTVER